jgi:hypothetical protein
VKAAELRRIEIGGAGQLVNSRPVENLIAVDVPNAADRLLVKQQRLDLPAATQQPGQVRPGEIQRLDPYPGKRPSDPVSVAIAA